MKNIAKEEAGISLISIVVTILVLGILTTILMYSIKGPSNVSEITKLNSDIDNLTDKVSAFYLEYGQLPIEENINGLQQLIPNNWEVLGANDTGDFAVINLNAIEGLTLNYGRDFENIKARGSILSNEKDVYIINKNSHNIFYLKGIRVNNIMYYTNKSKDTEAVNLKYAYGVKIYEGYSYESGNKESGIIISSNSNSQNKYKWIDLTTGNYTLSNDGTYFQDSSSNRTNIAFLNAQNGTKLLESVKQYQGFYLKQNDSAYVLYFTPVEEKWSKTYDVESMYRDSNEDIAYIPAGFQVSKLANKSVINKGLVIKDVNTNRQYVWIDVPDNVLKNTATVSDIETNLKQYVISYQSSSYTDTWYDGCGITSSQYNQLKESMYNNIKNRGGFWISADQIGNNITCSDAQTAAGQTNTSLLFGIQWDLACKFISENTGGDSGDAANLNILNFGTSKAEWTLEDSSSASNTTPSASNSVVRGGSNNRLTRTAYNYATKNTNIAYRVAIN